MFSSHTNFLFIPDPQHTQSGLFYELGEAEYCYRENALVLIPYQNPSNKNICPEYYHITNKRRINFPVAAASETILLTPTTSKNNYLNRVAHLKEHIKRGDIYEINYCIEFYAENINLDVAAAFARLHTVTKAPYSALLKVGNNIIICASPELFLKKQGITVSSKPIKGTAPRGKDEAEDELLKNNLYHSLKERTENVMAVDVVRNDLSRFAKKGSVQVNKLYNIETFKTVHQMVSTVSCEAIEGTGFEQMLHATFPMASMTGAPKIRAMQLIDVTEEFTRQYYSGAMGIIDNKGDFTLSVIIRSIFYNLQYKRLSIAVGGAITYLSEPQKEYDECLLKAGALLKALNATIKGG